MNRNATHKEGLTWACSLLEMVMEDVTTEQAHWVPPGIANPLGAIYAHAVLGIDSLINALFQRKQPLFARDWAGKTGISEPKWGMEIQWARNLQVDLPAARTYAQAVYQNAQDYLDKLHDQDLDRQLDLTAQGLGVHSLSWCLEALVTGHIHNMTGEVSVLKGIQGSRGYPF
jgi:hypothetical protein